MAYEEIEEQTGFVDMDFVDPNTETPKEAIDEYVDHMNFPRHLFGKHWHDPEGLREFLYAKNGVAKKRGVGRPPKGSDAGESEG